MSQAGNRSDHLQPIVVSPPLSKEVVVTPQELDEIRIARERLASKQKRYSTEEVHAFLADLDKSRKGK
jgi:hypothetical protein